LTARGILVDTFAWLEMMKGSKKGANARSVVRDTREIFISVLTLYELQYRLAEITSDKDAAAIIQRISSQAEIIPVDHQIAIHGGQIKLRQRKLKTAMGAVDCLILATAQIYNLKVLTGDPHFNQYGDTILI